MVRQSSTLEKRQTFGDAVEFAEAYPWTRIQIVSILRKLCSPTRDNAIRKMNRRVFLGFPGDGRYRALFRHSSSLIFHWDLIGGVSCLNPADFVARSGREKEASI